MSKIFNALYDKYPEISNCKTDIEKAFQCLTNTYDNGGKVLICGNGGSAADSEHIAGELMKGFNLKRELSPSEKAVFSKYENGQYIANNLQKALPAISLVSQTSLITAFVNDVAADMLFAQQVYGYAKKNDTLIALTTSGNSQNIINAARTAEALGCNVLSITGKGGGEIKDNSTVCIRLPAISPYEVQEYTLPLYHALCAALEERYFSN